MRAELFRVTNYMTESFEAYKSGTISYEECMLLHIFHQTLAIEENTRQLVHIKWDARSHHD